MMKTTKKRKIECWRINRKWKIAHKLNKKANTNRLYIQTKYHTHLLNSCPFVIVMPRKNI